MRFWKLVMLFFKKMYLKDEEIAESGRTILYVSHNKATIRNLCNRCLVFDHGSLIYNGEVDKAIELYLGKIETDQGEVLLSDKSRTGQITES